MLIEEKEIFFSKESLLSFLKSFQLIRDKNAVSRAFSELAERFSARNGGYTRIMKLGNRRGDSAPMAIIEYLPSEHKEHAPTEKKAKVKKAKPAKEEKKKEIGKKAKPQKAAAKKAAPKKEAKKKTSAKTRSGRKVSKKDA